MDGAAFQEHQRPGGRAKRLRSSGHLVSFSGGPLSCGSRQWINENANLVESFRNATKRSQKAMEPSCAIQASGVVPAAIKDVDVMK